jgi:hypothetical protein
MATHTTTGKTIYRNPAFASYGREIHSDAVGLTRHQQHHVNPTELEIKILKYRPTFEEIRHTSIRIHNELRLLQNGMTMAYHEPVNIFKILIKEDDSNNDYSALIHEESRHDFYFYAWKWLRTHSVDADGFPGYFRKKVTQYGVTLTMLSVFLGKDPEADDETKNIFSEFLKYEIEGLVQSVFGKDSEPMIESLKGGDHYKQNVDFVRKKLTKDLDHEIRSFNMEHLMFHIESVQKLVDEIGEHFLPAIIPIGEYQFKKLYRKLNAAFTFEEVRIKIV